MIRLTEVAHHGQEVDLRIEGELTERDLPVFEQELHRYADEGVTVVRLLADGLTSLSPRISSEQRWPAGQEVRFLTRRAALLSLLVSYGLSAEDPGE